MTKDDSGHAFPVMDVHSTHDDDGRGEMNGITTETYGGMTLRDYFAGQALAALLTHAIVSSGNIAGAAYEYADAMLEARAKE